MVYREPGKYYNLVLCKKKLEFSVLIEFPVIAVADPGLSLAGAM